MQGGKRTSMQGEVLPVCHSRGGGCESGGLVVVYAQKLAQPPGAPPSSRIHTAFPDVCDDGSEHGPFPSWGLEGGGSWGGPGPRGF